MGEHPELGAIVPGSSNWPERSGFETIAEGIETGAQLGQLCDQHCELGQGYLFARPLPLEQAEALLDRAPGAAMTSDPSPPPPNMSDEQPVTLADVARW